MPIYVYKTIQYLLVVNLRVKCLLHMISQEVMMYVNHKVMSILQ